MRKTRNGKKRKIAEYVWKKKRIKKCTEQGKVKQNEENR